MNRDTIIFNFRKGFQPLKEAFEANGYRVAENEWAPAPQLAARCEAAIVNLYEAIRQPWNAVVLHRRLRAAGSPLIGVDRDAPWHLGIRWRRLALFRLLRPIDIYATHTLQPTWDFAPVKIYSPNAVWVRHFNLRGHSLEEMRNPNFYEYDVSFLGNLDGQRFKEHARREHFFKVLADRLAKLGIRYRFAQGTGVALPEQVNLIQRSRINLNYGAAADHGAVRSWGLPERCYGVPACGGFLLSDERKHASDDFDVASEWAGFTDLDDCVGKIQYWLAHFEDSRRIAEAAYARVRKHHTYELRARNLLSADQSFIEADAT